jgi:hypothetical protein
VASFDHLGPDGTVYLDAYLDLTKTHWLGMSCVPCSRVQAISIPAAIRLAGRGSTFGDLQRRLRCVSCSAALSMVLCSDSRPDATRDRNGHRPETLG